MPTLAFCPAWLKIAVLGIKALLADAMAELGMGMIADILLYLFPETRFVPDLLAVHAYRDDTAQGLYLFHCLTFLAFHKRHFIP